MTLRIPTCGDEGVIPIDFDDIEGNTTPTDIDPEEMQALGRAAANASSETAERIAQAIERMPPVIMSPNGLAHWVRSGRWAV